jgi:hypothetical protein
VSRTKRRAGGSWVASSKTKRRYRARWTKRKDGLVATSYTPEGLGQNGADGLHGLKDGPCDILF